MLLSSRSAEESLAYLRLTPCSCGETEFQRTESVRCEGQQTVKEYQGPCARCGTPRSFQFIEAQLPPTPAGRVVFGPEGTTSALLDPGQWLLLARRAARAVTSGTDDSAAPSRMAYAIAALEEVLRFLPPTAGDFDAVATSCFVSTVGRGVLAKEPPGAFQKARLVARLLAYQRLRNQKQQVSPDGPALAPVPAAAPAAPSMPPPGSLVVIDREKRTLSFPTYVVGPGALAFLAAVRLATAGPGGALSSGPPADAGIESPLRTMTWLPVPLGAVRGYVAMLHLYGFDDDPQLAAALAVEACHARGVVVVQGESGRSGPPSVLLPSLAESLGLLPCPVVVFGDVTFAAHWGKLGGPVPTARVDPAAGALAAFRAIGKAMLLAL